MIGLQSYLSIRRCSQDIGFMVFDLDQDRFFKEKVHFVNQHMIVSY